MFLRKMMKKYIILFVLLWKLRWKIRQQRRLFIEVDIVSPLVPRKSGQSQKHFALLAQLFVHVLPRIRLTFLTLQSSLNTLPNYFKSRLKVLCRSIEPSGSRRMSWAHVWPWSGHSRNKWAPFCHSPWRRPHRAEVELVAGAWRFQHWTHNKSPSLPENV